MRPFAVTKNCIVQGLSVEVFSCILWVFCIILNWLTPAEHAYDICTLKESNLRKSSF